MTAIDLFIVAMCISGGMLAAWVLVVFLGMGKEIDSSRGE